MACRASCLVQVYYAISNVVFSWSFMGFAPILWIRGVFGFYYQFPFDFPWRGCSWHVKLNSPLDVEKETRKYKSLDYANGGFAVCAISSSLPAVSKVAFTSSSDAPLGISILSWRGSTWFMLTLLLLTPVTFFGPVISTKLLSMTSIMTHFLPVSRPASFTQILPTSIAGTRSASLKTQITRASTHI
jgi:hypothetical protein